MFVIKTRGVVSVMATFPLFEYAARKLSSLKGIACFTLKACGKHGMQDIVENNIRLAHQLGAFVEQCEPFC